MRVAAETFSGSSSRPIRGWLRKRTASISLLLAVVGVAAWFVFLRPQFLGGPATYVVVSGSSMKPTLANGDLVLALRRNSYEVGDVVAYRIPEGEVGEGRVVIHRIIGGSASEGFVIQGDNRHSPDIWRPREGDIVAEMVLVIPGGGIVFGVLRSPIVFASFVGLVTFFAVLWFTFAPSEESAVTATAQEPRDERGGRERHSYQETGLGTEDHPTEQQPEVTLSIPPTSIQPECPYQGLEQELAERLHETWRAARARLLAEGEGDAPSPHAA